MFGLGKKLNVQNCLNSTRKCTLYVRNVWSCQKIKYSEQCKFNGKFCTLYVPNVWICRKFITQNCVNSTVYLVHKCRECLDLQKKLNVWNIENSSGNCVHYICTKCQDLKRN